MTVLPMPPYRVLELAREYAALTTPVERSALYAEWLRRYGDDPAYDLFTATLGLITWPEDPAAFRAQWAAPSVRDPEIRAAVAALTDGQIVSIGEALRDAYLRAPSEIPNTWHLAKQLAGVA